MARDSILAAAVDGGHLPDSGVAAEAGKMEYGGEEGRGDAGG